ncbi:DNA polymerase epsilon subunit 3 [Taenia crassiceps]|uniref:DNA polymerase epsilon subunit 3 n=1 Tax=Taenia crassiceps TaxID=6207 RepID=A0ABR4Q3V2_9CEST
MSEKSDDLYLPNSVIMRIVREAFPEDASIMVSREARSALSKAASSFVLCVTSMASVHCEAGKRKTLAASDVIGALRDMQFGHFESPLLQFLETYRELAAAKKASKRSITAIGEASDMIEDIDEAM